MSSSDEMERRIRELQSKLPARSRLDAPADPPDEAAALARLRALGEGTPDVESTEDSVEELTRKVMAGGNEAQEALRQLRDQAPAWEAQRAAAQAEEECLAAERLAESHARAAEIETRREAVKAVLASGTPPPLPALLDLLARGLVRDTDVAAVADALVAHGAQALEAVAAFPEHAAGDSSAVAYRVVTQLLQPHLATHLPRLVNAPNAFVRRAVIDTISPLRDDNAVAAKVTLLRDADAYIAIKAQDALLSDASRPEVRDALLPALEQPWTGSDPGERRARVAAAVGAVDRGRVRALLADLERLPPADVLRELVSLEPVAEVRALVADALPLTPRATGPESLELLRLALTLDHASDRINLVRSVTSTASVLPLTRESWGELMPLFRADACGALSLSRHADDWMADLIRVQPDELSSRLLAEVAAIRRTRYLTHETADDVYDAGSESYGPPVAGIAREALEARQAADRFAVRCECGHRGKARRELAGHEVLCPRCQRTFIATPF